MKTLESFGTVCNPLEAIGNSEIDFGKTELVVYKDREIQTQTETNLCIELRYAQLCNARLDPVWKS